MKKIRQTCIIDDDDILVFVVQRLLKHEGICTDFLTYNDGSKAISGLNERVNNNQELPDLILLDISMPVMNGWEFLNSLQKLNFPKLPLIFVMTTSIDPRDAEKAKSLNIVSEYIVKPLDSNIIKNLIVKNMK